METRLLQIFLSVAETANFSRSAEQLHLSVSAVSRSVQRLESELGQALFERDKRQVRMTPAGRAFREYAQRTVTDWQQVRRTLGSDHALAGEVSLYCSVTASYRVLSPVLESFRVTHPDVEIMLHTGDQADGVGRILDGIDDIAVSGRPAKLPERLAFAPLTDSPMRFCMPAADCAVRRTVLAGLASPAGLDWSQLPFIVPERGITKEMLDAWFDERDARPSIYAQVAGHEAIVAMVGLGLGVGIAPELVIAASGLESRVEYIEVDRPLPALSIGMCVLRQRLQSPLVRALWDVAEQTYRRAV